MTSLVVRYYLHLPTKRSSWHVLGRVDDRGWWSLCGLLMGDGYRTANSLPWGEKTCETCLAMAARSDEGPSDDPVPE